METLQETYKKTIVPTLMKELNIKSLMAVPKLVKIVVNCGMGTEALKDKKTLESMATQLSIITGQKAAVTRAKRAIATFKLRAGDPIGLKVTLRGRRMYDFFTKLIAIALPRVRDFRGVPAKSLDGKGNYTLGISDQTIFPELEYKLIDKVRGFEIVCVTSAGSDKAARRLLELLGVPFEKGERS
ncbi:50S ribosomal protein L5 [Candidatus Gottesmanbacteria bacterium]|nr:50S ribosomal protein L5 [Candidatus Gottesmanbacteria bacterium]